MDKMQKIKKKKLNRKTIDRLEESAYHEAGHVVVALYYGIKIKKVEISKKLGKKGIGGTVYCEDDDENWHKNYDWKHHAAVRVAGGLAELKKIKLEIRDDERDPIITGALEDMKFFERNKPKIITRAKDMHRVDELMKFTQKDVLDAQARANLILDHNWKQVELIAKTLIEKRRINSKGLRTLIKKHSLVKAGRGELWEYIRHYRNQVKS